MLKGCDWFASLIPLFKDFTTWSEFSLANLLNLDKYNTSDNS